MSKLKLQTGFVGDVQDVIQTAIGGINITMTHLM